MNVAQRAVDVGALATLSWHHLGALTDDSLATESSVAANPLIAQMRCQPRLAFPVVARNCSSVHVPAALPGGPTKEPVVLPPSLCPCVRAVGH